MWSISKRESETSTVSTRYITTQQQQNQNFKKIIVFQLLNGCSEAELNKLRLVRDPAAYFYVCHGGDGNKPSPSDRADYKTVTSAISTLGFTQDEAQCIWSVVAGILHLVIIKNSIY